jgi:hypothetical protein
MVNARTKGPCSKLGWLKTRIQMPICFRSRLYREVAGQPVSCTSREAFGKRIFATHRLRVAFARVRLETSTNRSRRLARAALTHDSVERFFEQGNRRRSCGLPGGAEGIQTAMLLAMRSGGGSHPNESGTHEPCDNRLDLRWTVHRSVRFGDLTDNMTRGLDHFKSPLWSVLFTLSPCRHVSE